MATAATQMAQLNLRIDGQDKLKAEEVLHLMGTTATEVVRKLYAKVARGAKDYDEVMAVLEGPAASTEQEVAEPGVNPLVLEGWALGERFMQSLGYTSMAEVPSDDRPWEEMYDEAMTERARKKGWLE